MYKLYYITKNILKYREALEVAMWSVRETAETTAISSQFNSIIYINFSYVFFFILFFKASQQYLKSPQTLLGQTLCTITVIHI